MESKYGGQEVPLPSFFDLIAFLHLNDATAPVSHAVRNVHVLNDSLLQSFAQLVDRRLAQGRVDIIAIQHVNPQQVNQWVSRALAPSDRCNLGGWRLITLPHITTP